MEKENEQFNVKKPSDEQIGIHTQVYENYKKINSVKSPYREQFIETAKQINFPIIHEDSLRFLQFWVSMTQPKKILELGTGFGFLATHLLQMKTDLEIVGVDYTSENYERFNSIVNDVSIKKRYFFVEANVIYWIQQIKEEFDWVIIDVDKKFYPVISESAANLVKSGGYLIADNVLWKGMVSEENLKPKVEPIIVWNNWLRENKNFDSVIVPIGDGLGIGRKQ